MSGQCQACAGRSSDLFLCPQCITQLRHNLKSLPWWIERLQEAAIGQVNMGESGGRSTQRREPFKGDDEVLAKCKCGHPEHEGRACGATDTHTEPVESDDPDAPSEVIVLTICQCTEYQPAADQVKLRAQFLAAGRVNARASQRLDAVRNSLGGWIRHACETRGIRLVHPRFIGPLRANEARGPHRSSGDYARWLYANVHAIACDEAAGECYADVDGHMRAIEKIVNRPLAMRFLGKCPTWNEHTRRACGTELQCREGTIEVTCPSCRRTHNADRLQLLMMSDLERKKLTIERIRELNRTVIPEEFRISERTLRHWLQHGKLKPRGYRRADGREVINRHSDDDKPLYLWADVTRLRGEKPEPKVGAR